MKKNISPSVLAFLRDLQDNNNRDWFTDNKAKYEEAKSDFVLFMESLIAEIATFDPPIGGLSAKKSVFRIYRDTRFSKDKTPYKINMGAHLVNTGAKPHDRAGYYIHIEPGNCFLAGGAYMPPSKWIKAIRQEIVYNADEFRGIVQHKDFKKYFGEMEGEQLKTAPRGYPKDHAEIELLRYKSFLGTHQLEDKKISSPNFLNHCSKVFKALKPFDDFLNKSLD